MFGLDPLVEVAAAAFIVACATFCQLAYRPFTSLLLNRIEAAGLMVAFVTQLGSIMYGRLQEPEPAPGVSPTPMRLTHTCMRCLPVCRYWRLQPGAVGETLFTLALGGAVIAYVAAVCVLLVRVTSQRRSLLHELAHKMQAHAKASSSGAGEGGVEMRAVRGAARAGAGNAGNAGDSGGPGEAAPRQAVVPMVGAQQNPLFNKRTRFKAIPSQAHGRSRASMQQPRRGVGAAAGEGAGVGAGAGAGTGTGTSLASTKSLPRNRAGRVGSRRQTQARISRVRTPKRSKEKTAPASTATAPVMASRERLRSSSDDSTQWL